MALFTALLLGALLAPGCASWDRTTDTENIETESSFASQFREVSPDGKKTGFDRRAREIEGSLGME